MNIENKELIDGLCQRYVLGTMHGAARKRFERILLENSSVAQALSEWEDLLSPLAMSLEPVQPSELASARIMRAVKQKEERRPVLVQCS